MKVLIGTICVLLLLRGELPAQQFTSSNLPIVVLSGQAKGHTIPVDSFWFDQVVFMGVIDNGPGKRNNITDPYNVYNGDVVIRVQGSSTVGFPKRSFRVSTVNPAGQQTPASLLGMPAHEDWVFKALYQDRSFLRDDLAFRIFNQMGHYSSRSRFFELVIDGEYKGVYHLLEKIRRDTYRVDIPKTEPVDNAGDELTGGYIFALDKYVSGVDRGWYSKHKSHGELSNYFLFYYPNGDTITPQQASYIMDYVDRFENAVASPQYTTAEGYRKYIDVPSFIDFFIINELSRNVDAYRASTYIHKHQSSNRGGKLTAGPIWDYNLGFGNCTESFGADPVGWNYPMAYEQNHIPFWWKRFMSDSSFVMDLRCRYRDLRKNVLSEAALFRYIDDMAAYFNEAQQRNFTKYPILNTNIPPNYGTPPGSYAGEIAYLKWWLHERIKWMDGQLSGPCVAAAVVEDLMEGDKVAAYPNPFHENFSIAYKTTEGMTARLELLNLVGSTVMVISDEKKKEGISQEQVNAGSLPAGYYVLKISLNDQTYYRKVIKTDAK
jgi:hypothetical protein